MTFDQTTLIWCVAVPAVLAAAGGLMARKLPVAARGLPVAAGWWLAVTAALIGLQGWQWWPEDAWRQSIWPLLGWALAISGTAMAENQHAWRPLAASLLAIVTAAIAMPGSSGWEDTFSLHRIWLPLIAASCLLNSVSLEHLSRTGGHRWSLLVALAGLGGPLAIAASTYGSLAQWTLAMIVATGTMAALAVNAEFQSAAWTAAMPATVGGAAITAAARFYSYESYPAWLYGAVLFLPTAVVLLDLTVQRRSAWTRVAVSGATSAAIVAVCVWHFLLG